MYYCYLRTIKKLDHSAALKKVLYLFCSFVIGTIITLIIIFTTEDPSGANGGNVPSSASSPSTGATDDDTTNTAEHMDGGAHGMESGAMNAENGGVTFWIFDVIFPILEGVFALLYSYITVSLVYKIAKHGHQGYHLWLCCVNAFGFWLLTFWIPSWKITEISILCTAHHLSRNHSHPYMSGIPPLPLMYPINPNPYIPFNIPRALDRISQKTDQSHDEILLTQQSLQQIMSHNASASEKITACTKTIVNQLDLFDDKLKQSGNAHENIRDNLQYFIDEQSNINDEMKQSRNTTTTKLDKMHSDLLQNQSRNAHTTDAKVDTIHTHLRRFITKQSNINDQMKQSRNTSAIKLDQMHSDLSQCIENQSRNAQTIHADLHHFITKQSAINDEVHQYLKRKQNEEDKAKQIANDEKETFRLWLENIGLSQYYHHFISNGFENMRTVINVNMFILEMIGIEKIGHKISILNQIEKIGQRREQHMETTLAKNQIDYYNDGNNMEMEKLAKKYRDNARQLENEYRNSIKQIIQLNYSSNVDMHRHWTKGAVLRDYVLSKFEQRRKKEKLKDKIVVETIAIDCGRNQFIHDFIKLNERNPFASDPKINKTHVQSDMIRRIKIENHDRIPQLNGEYGVIAAIDIAKNTIIGEYTGKTILVEDLMMVGVESIVNEIDSYGFDAIIECEMTQRQWDAFNNNEDIETLPPPAKKRKLNHNNKVSGHKMISKKIDVIIDGWNAVPRSLLTCINDCRDDFQNREPTQNDKKYFNIKLMTCDVNGWPRVFGIALRDIAEGEELSTFYGSGFIEVQNKKNKLMQRKEQILKILSKHEMKIDI